MASRTTLYVGILVVVVVLIAGGLYYSGMVGQPAKYTLSVQVIGQGTTSPAAGATSQNSGSVVSVTATPATGWVFSNWILNGSNSTTNPFSVTVNFDTVLKAVFKTVPPTPMSKYSLTIQVQGQGTTNPAPGATQLNNGASVTVTPTAGTGYTFDHWLVNGQTSTTTPLALTMSTDYSVTAVFKLTSPPIMSRFSLTIQTQGQGTTNPTPGVTQVTNGNGVAITATPAVGWFFDHYVVNGLNVTMNPYTVIMSTDYSVTAIFKLGNAPSMGRWSLTIATQGQGTTTPVSGVTQVTNGASVAITASPVVGWSFDHWVVNGQNSTANPLTIMMGTDYSVTAVFKLGGTPSMGRWSLDIQIQGQGTTSPTPGITQVANGVPVTITATPASGWEFFHWIVNGQNVTTNPLINTMSTDYSVTAVFRPSTTPSMARWSLTIQTQGGGLTNPLPGVTSVPNGNTVTVTATPDTGKLFDHWIVNGQSVTTNPITITMTTDYSLTAVFK